VVVLVRGARGGVVLPHWLQNLIGLVILMLVVAIGGWGIGPLRPLGHLLLLLHTVCLVMIVDRRSFQRALALVGVVWVIAVAGSSHILLIPYLILSIALGWWTGMRVLLLDGDYPPRAQHEDRGLGLWSTPRPLHVATATVCVVLLTVPLFLMMPRLRSALLATDIGQGPVTGFSSVISLAKVGTIEMSSRPVMAVFPSRDVSWKGGQELYFRGAVYDPVVDEGLWIAREEKTEELVQGSGLLWLSSELRDAGGRVIPVRVELIQPDSYVFTPPGTVALRAHLPLYRDSGGAIQVDGRDQRLLGYEAWVRADAQPPLPPPDVRDLLVAEGDGRLFQLAQEVAGDLDGARARAQAISDHLHGRCTYSLESNAPADSDPFTWFLFEGQAGHCEFFAGAMVVLLRHLEVPARLVGGYVGGSYNADLDGLVIRQSNAHTWVEVWVEKEARWVRFDPTPAVGVPSRAELTGVERLQWIWGRMQAYFERRIITFGMGDQLRLAEAVLGPRSRTAVGEALRATIVPALVAAVIGVAAVYAVRLWRRVQQTSRRGPAAGALHRLERRLTRAGVIVPAAATPRALAVAATVEWPGCQHSVERVVCLAEKELYGERALGTDELRVLRRAMDDLRQRAKGS
jgi:transglutaminase-like putative cysteine protease